MAGGVRSSWSEGAPRWKDVGILANARTRERSETVDFSRPTIKIIRVKNASVLTIAWSVSSTDCTAVSSKTAPEA